MPVADRGVVGFFGDHFGRIDGNAGLHNGGDEVEDAFIGAESGGLGCSQAETHDPAASILALVRECRALFTGCKSVEVLVEGQEFVCGEERFDGDIAVLAIVGEFGWGQGAVMVGTGRLHSGEFYVIKGVPTSVWAG